MARTRVLWLMVGFSILLVRTSEGMPADKKSKETMSSTTPSSLSSYSSSSSTDQTTSDTSTPSTTSTSASTTETSTGSTPTMSGVTSTPASNYTSTENVTSSSTPPPYIDQYGNNLPKVVNASTQYYNETTDIMEALPLVPLEDIGGGNAINGNQAWIIYRIPQGAVNQPMAMQPNQMPNYDGYQNEDQTDMYTCSNTQPESQMQQPGAIRVVLQPVQAFQADYYKVDDASSSASAPMMKPLNDFFYR